MSEKLFYVIDDYYEMPKWARNLKGDRKMRPPEDHEVLYIYGTEKLCYIAYYIFTPDTRWVEEQLKRIYDENVDEETGNKKVKVERWRK